MRILDSGFDFEAVANDAGVEEQTVNVFLSVAGDTRDLEVVKGLSVVPPLLQNRQPAQPGLRPFQNEKLKKASVIMNRNAPFSIVV